MNDLPSELRSRAKKLDDLAFDRMSGDLERRAAEEIEQLDEKMDGQGTAMTDEPQYCEMCGSDKVYPYRTMEDGRVEWECKECGHWHNLDNDAE